MRSQADPLGMLLVRTGALTEEQLGDVLDHQRRAMPLGSLCYILGYLDEDTLARGLARQFGMPAVVLDRSVVRLDVLEAVSRETAMQHNILPVYEDEQRIFVAVADPHQAAAVMREIHLVSGKTPVAHVALQITLARSIRASYAARKRGERFHRGGRADSESLNGHMAVVADMQSSPEDVSASPVAGAVMEDVTRELEHHELHMVQDLEATNTIEMEPVMAGGDTGDTVSQDQSVDLPTEQVKPLPEPVSFLDLDAGEGAVYEPGHGGPQRVLIVDDDFATRHLLVKVLQPRGFLTATSATGGEAIRQLKASPPDLIILDVMLPEMDGFQICRAIKRSRKYSDIAVILMSAMVASERVSSGLLMRYGANAYFGKPLDIDRMVVRIHELIRAPGRRATTGGDDGFEQAIELYKMGDVDGAIGILRSGLATDPLSAKHHFVLANLLQKQSLLYEAIEEYETTVELTPDYFPALTRLAYLYYRKGFAAKAIEVWQRALAHCPDPTLRQNIERLVRRLTEAMKSA